MALKLGVNIDHVATLRQARGGLDPNVERAAREAVSGGADSITVHLREDRRHIQDCDVWTLKKVCKVPLNLEMSVTQEIVRIALRLRPEKVCIVPEKRQEITTEGGLDVLNNWVRLKKITSQLQQKKIQVSFFIDPHPDQVKAAAQLGADAIEIHTGSYAHAWGSSRQKKEFEKIKKAADLAKAFSLHVHAGHGLDYQNVKPIVGIKMIEELNIGHAIISRAIFVGLEKSVLEIKHLIRRDC